MGTWSVFRQIFIVNRNQLAQRKANPWAGSGWFTRSPEILHYLRSSDTPTRIPQNLLESCRVPKFVCGLKVEKKIFINSTTGGMNRKLPSSNFHCGVIGRSKKWLASCCCIRDLASWAEARPKATVYIGRRNETKEWRLEDATASEKEENSGIAARIKTGSIIYAPFPVYCTPPLTPNTLQG